jgi:hypothetical protein
MLESPAEPARTRNHPPSSVTPGEAHPILV